MRIWLVNPFDPLPGEPEQEGRYAGLARLLCRRGHTLTWWTSSFSHRFKRPVNAQAVAEACRGIGMAVKFVQSPPYFSNVSWARLANHRTLARRFAAEAPREGPPPDVIVASAPPPLLARQATRFAHDCGSKVIVDVQDLWPDTFRRLAPAWARPAFDVVLWPWRRASSQAYAAADAIVGVAEAYRQEALAVGGEKALSATIPLGVDLSEFDAAAERGRCKRLTKPRGETWLIYSGSLSRSYDCLTLTEAFARVAGRTPQLRLFITGLGELSERLGRVIRKHKLRNVTRMGFLDFNSWAYLLTQCDIGFNPSLPEALICLPNKVFYYFAAGLAVLNTIAGECSDIIRAAECGLDYRAGDAGGCAAAIESLTSEAGRLGAMCRASRRLAEEEYDRGILYPRYADLIERVAGAAPATRAGSG